MRFRIILIGFCTLLLIACGGGGDNNSSDPIDISGRWIAACYFDAESNDYTNEQYDFSGNNITTSFESFTNSSCSGAPYEQGQASGTYTLGDIVTTSGGIAVEFNGVISIDNQTVEVFDLIHVSGNALNWGVFIDDTTRPTAINFNEPYNKQLDGPAPTLSNGLKIFATSALHVGDFLNDPFLSGQNAIEKADSFCSQDLSRPNNSAYKALLIDGIIRDAKSLNDWVLLPNTTYYRASGDIEIGTTTGLAIFSIIFQDFSTSIDDRQLEGLPQGREWPNNAWSGVTDLTDYTTDGSRNCSNWSTSSDFSQGIYANTDEKSSNALSTNGSVYCGAKLRLYCVEQ